MKQNSKTKNEKHNPQNKTKHTSTQTTHKTQNIEQSRIKTQKTQITKNKHKSFVFTKRATTNCKPSRPARKTQTLTSTRIMLYRIVLRWPLCIASSTSASISTYNSISTNLGSSGMLEHPPPPVLPKVESQRGSCLGRRPLSWAVP